MNSQWSDFFKQEATLESHQKMEAFLHHAYQHKTIYPPRDQRYQAFHLCPLSSLKVVILGQDPYHQAGQANGLAFSVNSGVKLPRSLVNIYQEIENDIGVTMNFQDGDLSYLARQGVLLMNTILTVEDSLPLSHQHIGYQAFFNRLLNWLDTQDQPMVFLLWGGHAKAYAKQITHPRRLILEANHPSPLSANRGGWFGHRHFSQTNAWLEKYGLPIIQWTNTLK